MPIVINTGYDILQWCIKYENDLVFAYGPQPKIVGHSIYDYVAGIGPDKQYYPRVDAPIGYFNTQLDSDENHIVSDTTTGADWTDPVNGWDSWTLKNLNGISPTPTPHSTPTPTNNPPYPTPTPSLNPTPSPTNVPVSGSGFGLADFAVVGVVGAIVFVAVSQKLLLHKKVVRKKQSKRKR